MLLNIKSSLNNLNTCYTFKILKFKTIATYTGTTEKTYIGQGILFRSMFIIYIIDNIIFLGKGYRLGFLITSITFPLITILSSSWT